MKLVCSFFPLNTSKIIIGILAQCPLSNCDLMKFIKPWKKIYFWRVFIRNNLPNKFRQYETEIIKLTFQQYRLESRWKEIFSCFYMVSIASWFCEDDMNTAFSSIATEKPKAIIKKISWKVSHILHYYSLLAEWMTGKNIDLLLLVFKP